MSGPIPRREFLARASVLPLGVAAVAGLDVGSTHADDRVSIRRHGGPKLKTSLNAYSFSKALGDGLKGGSGGMSLFDLLDICADLNFDAIDPTGYFFPGYPEVPSNAFLNDFKRRAFQLGLDISGTGVRNNFATPDKAARAADVRHVKQWIECAARMGAPVIRVFAGPEPEGHTFEQVASWMADDLRECVEHGQQYGVLVGVQNHGDTLKTADQVLKIVAMVDSDWFGVIVDTGYFLTPDPYLDIARVLPHAVNWQIKEKLTDKDGSRKTDLRKLVGIVQGGGYRGYLPIETLSVRGEDYDPLARVTEMLAELRSAIDQAE